MEPERLGSAGAQKHPFPSHVVRSLRCNPLFVLHAIIVGDELGSSQF